MRAKAMSIVITDLFVSVASGQRPVNRALIERLPQLAEQVYRAATEAAEVMGASPATINASGDRQKPGFTGH